MSDTPADPTSRLETNGNAEPNPEVKGTGEVPGQPEAAVTEKTAAADELASAERAAREKSAPPELTPKTKRDRSNWYWALGIATLLCVEVYIYGRNGLVEVCVGVEGVTNFDARGQARTPQTQRALPQCVQRMNLGMYDHAEELAMSALRDACGRATMTNKTELTACMNRDKKWTRRVYKQQVPPWDKRLYRRLLWLD